MTLCFSDAARCRSPQILTSTHSDTLLGSIYGSICVNDLSVSIRYACGTFIILFLFFHALHCNSFSSPSTHLIRAAALEFYRKDAHSVRVIEPKPLVTSNNLIETVLRDSNMFLLLSFFLFFFYKIFIHFRCIKVADSLFFFFQHMTYMASVQRSRNACTAINLCSHQSLIAETE